MTQPIEFTTPELNVLKGHPDALEAAADYNDQQECEADAVGADSCVEHHKARAHELRAEAARIRTANRRA